MLQYVEDQGIRIGAVNPNAFQDDHYRLGSLGNPLAAVRELALVHIFECCEMLTEFDSDTLSLWCADGMDDLFCQYPDYEIFDCLPGAKELLAPSFLDKFGDDRERFPDSSSVQALARTCPVTVASGKRRMVRFRRRWLRLATLACSASRSEQKRSVRDWRLIRHQAKTHACALFCLMGIKYEKLS